MAIASGRIKSHLAPVATTIYLETNNVDVEIEFTICVAPFTFFNLSW